MNRSSDYFVILSKINLSLWAIKYKLYLNIIVLGVLLSLFNVKAYLFKENVWNVCKVREKLVSLHPFSGMWDSQEFHILFILKLYDR